MDLRLPQTTGSSWMERGGNLGEEINKKVWEEGSLFWDPGLQLQSIDNATPMDVSKSHGLGGEKCFP